MVGYNHPLILRQLISKCYWKQCQFLIIRDEFCSRNLTEISYTTTFQTVKKCICNQWSKPEISSKNLYNEFNWFRSTAVAVQQVSYFTRTQPLWPGHHLLRHNNDLRNDTVKVAKLMMGFKDCNDIVDGQHIVLERYRHNRWIPSSMLLNRCRVA